MVKPIWNPYIQRPTLANVRGADQGVHMMPVIIQTVLLRAHRRPHVLPTTTAWRPMCRPVSLGLGLALAVGLLTLVLLHLRPVS